MEDRIKKTHQFSHPIQNVWEAITIGEKISTWFIKTNFQAQKGFLYTFKHEEGENCTTINGEVKTVNPMSELVYTWIVEGTDVVTTVSWKLTANEKGTLLDLEHSGISNYDSETAVAMFESFSGGWDNCVADLGKYLTT